MKIAIIDSGIGGLSILNYLLSFNKNIHVAYIADNEYFPYGIKSDEELIVIISRLITYFYQENYDKIILACNTASLIYEKYLKNDYGNKVYSIIDSTILELANSKNKIIGVIGTNKTINANIYQQKLKAKQFNKVVSLPCSELVNYCEENDLQNIISYVNNNFQVFKDNNIDTFILGCTHFNMLQDFFKEYFENKVNIISSGFFLVNNLLSNITGNYQKQVIYLTKTAEEYKQKICFLFPNLKDIEINTLNI